MVHERITYICDWNRAHGRYRIWWVDKPEVWVEAGDFGECEAVFVEVLIEATDDCGAAIEYLRGYPEALLPRRFVKPGYVILCYDGFGKLVTEVGALFNGGRCAVCRMPRGERTSEQITLSRTRDAGDGLVISEIFPTAVYSERLLAALGLLSSPHFECRPVVIESRTQHRYFEVLPTNAKVSLAGVGVKGLEGRQKRVRCVECCRDMVSIQGKYHHILDFVAARDLEEVPGGIFLYEATLGVPLTMWKSLREATRPKGMVARQIGIARDEDIDFGLPVEYLRPPNPKPRLP